MFPADGYVFVKRFSAAVVEIGSVSQGKIVCSGFCSPMVTVAFGGEAHVISHNIPVRVWWD
jgi:hypothetical protein